MKHSNQLHLRVSGSPVIEFDPSVMAWYIRFKNTKVAKTLSDTAPKAGYLYTIDLDANNEVVGIELLGVAEFQISMLKKLPIDTSKVNFEHARFVAVAPRELAAS